MGLTRKEKAELAAYKLKDVAQVWFDQWRDERPFRYVHRLEMFKEDFLDRFFPLEFREKKMVEFMNLHQGGMSVQDYYLKFVMAVSSLVMKECRITIFLKTDISRLVEYPQKIEDSKIW